MFSIMGISFQSQFPISTRVYLIGYGEELSSHWFLNIWNKALCNLLSHQKCQGNILCYHENRVTWTRLRKFHGVYVMTRLWMRQSVHATGMDMIRVIGSPSPSTSMRFMQIISQQGKKSWCLQEECHSNSVHKRRIGERCSQFPLQLCLCLFVGNCERAHTWCRISQIHVY